MKKFIVLVILAVSTAHVLGAAGQPGKIAPAHETADEAAGLISGQTQCLNHRKGIIAPTVLHPVVAVLVSLGDTVKKGQPLVKLDDDEPQADVRVKKANLENAGIAMREAKRYFASLEKLAMQGAISEQRLHDARATALKSEAEERAARAAVDVALAELEHYVVAAPIDGVINRLQVHVGMVSRPGTAVWGEVLDLREIGVRCAVTIPQAERLKVGDRVEVLAKDVVTSYGLARIVFIGLEANPGDGKVPVLVTLPNAEGRLRCETPVQLRFSDGRGKVASKE